MRKRIWILLVLPLCLCGCEREPLTDPVLFCESYNRISSQPIGEADAYLRTENELLLFAGGVIVRLRTNEDGAIHTVVVTGEDTPGTASAAQNAFRVLAEPFGERVPQSLLAQRGEQELSVQTAETKRFYYAVYRDGESVTAVQINLLLSSLPSLPALRHPEAE